MDPATATVMMPVENRASDSMMAAAAAASAAAAAASAAAAAASVFATAMAEGAERQPTRRELRSRSLPPANDV